MSQASWEGGTSAPARGVACAPEAGQRELRAAQGVRMALRTGGGTAGVEGAGFLYFSSNSPAYWIAQNISREEKHPALEGGRHVEKSRLVQVQVICT